MTVPAFVIPPAAILPCDRCSFTDLCRVAFLWSRLMIQVLTSNPASQGTAVCSLLSEMRFGVVSAAIGALPYISGNVITWHPE